MCFNKLRTSCSLDHCGRVCRRGQLDINICRHRSRQTGPSASLSSTRVPNPPLASLHISQEIRSSLDSSTKQAAKSNDSSQFCEEVLKLQKDLPVRSIRSLPSVHPSVPIPTKPETSVLDSRCTGFKPQLTLRCFHKHPRGIFQCCIHLESLSEKLSGCPRHGVREEIEEEPAFIGKPPFDTRCEQ